MLTLCSKRNSGEEEDQLTNPNPNETSGNAPGPTRKEKLSRKLKARQKRNEARQEKKASRSRTRREAASLHITTPKSVQDFPISKGGRCGRPDLETVMKAPDTGNEAEMREILRHFSIVPQSQ